MRRFRIVSVLAKGGMGVTYRAWDEAAGLPVVVKVPKKSLSEEPGFLERFDREARVSASLSHPHIVPVIDHGVEAGEPFLAMRFMPGGSLAVRIPRDDDGNPMPASASMLHVFLQPIASALDYAHAQGVVHRDVKPANIFLDAMGTAFLGDFGLVKLMGGEHGPDEATITGTNIAMGTQFYMAPERFVPRAEIDGRSDQYSLAVTAFELLAGKRPFTGETAHIVVEHATMPPPALAELRPDLPPSLCQAIDKALSKKPRDRFESCAAFAEEALRAVPKPRQDDGFARLLCPSCSRLLRLPVTAGGRQGNCPHCKEKMTIAPDLGSLWLVSEQAATELPAEPLSEVMINEEPAPEPVAAVPTKRTMLAAAAAAMAALTMAVVMAVWMNSTPPRQEVARIDHELPNQSAVSDENPTAHVEPAPLPSDDRSSTAAPEPAVPEPPMPEPPPQDPPRLEESPPPAIDEPAEAPAADLAPAVAVVAKDIQDAPPQPVTAEPEGDYFDHTVKWVVIGDAGNQADHQTGLGDVDYEFVLTQYELTNEQYCRFLNGSDAGRRNRYGLAHGPMTATNPAAGINAEEQPDKTFRYRPKPGMAEKPVANVRWADAARLANWLHNGATLAEDATEHGAYAIENRELDPVTALPKQEGARFWVPSVDEWFKAAYFRGGKSSAGYWKYPTATNTELIPAANTEAAVQAGLRGIETRANFEGQLPLTVGMNGAASAYGVFDMGGNAADLATYLPTDSANSLGVLAIACGGDYSAPRSTLDRAWFKSCKADTVAATLAMNTGIRLARAPNESGIPFSRDEAPRRLKAPSLAVVKGLQAIFPPGGKRGILLHECLPAELLKLKSRIQQLQRLDDGGLEEDVSSLLQQVAKDTASTLEILQTRQVRLNRLLPAGGQKQPPQDLMQLLTQVADDLQTRLDYEAIIAESREKLADLQDNFNEFPAKLTKLRRALEMRFGKS
jgi:serine/threonine-protein kinase